jgi:hypothetical protein
MSLPTYIRRRRVPRPQDFIAQSTGRPVAEVLRFLQELKKWENDFDGYYINPTKRHVRPFWLVPKLVSEQIVTLAPAGMPGDRVQGIAFEVDTQGHFEIAYAMFTALKDDGSAANNFVVEVFDGGNNMKGLQNAELHAAAIAGSARRPFIWPETYFLNVQDAPRTMFMNFRNVSADTIHVRWVFHGRRWYHKEADAQVQRAIQEKFERMEKTYTYFLTLSLAASQYPPPTAEGANPPGITLAAGQQLVENAAPFFWATSEADTEIHKLTYFATGPFEFQLREAESGRTLSNGFIQVTSGWGDGEFPFVLPETHLIERNYKVLFEVRDLSGAQNIIYPILTGRRLQYA